MLAAGAGRVGCLFFFCFFFFVVYFLLLFFLFFVFSSRLSYLPNPSSVGRRLDILKYCGFGRYSQAVVVSFYRRRAR